MSGNIFLERSFERDAKIIEKQLKELVELPGPIMIIIYPEGTRYTPEKQKASNTYALLNNLPKLKHVLHPRTKGLVTSICCIRDKIKSIYNVTLVYQTGSDAKPSTLNTIKGNSVTAHLYIERISIDNLPSSKNDLKKFFQDIFVQKDKLLESFLQTGDFFATSGVPRAPMILHKTHRRSLIFFVTSLIFVWSSILYYLSVLTLQGKLL